jgi:prepilin-type processing-associated H-X9-DG protein
LGRKAQDQNGDLFLDSLIVTDSKVSPNQLANNDFWIAGSRITCPYLTNSAVALAGELYSDTILPIIDNNAKIYITGVDDSGNPLSGAADTVAPSAKHESSSLMSGNFLFMDGHVEYIGQGQLASRRKDQGMFPALPPNLSNIPCP